MHLLGSWFGLFGYKWKHVNLFGDWLFLEMHSRGLGRFGAVTIFSVERTIAVVVRKPDEWAIPTATQRHAIGQFSINLSHSNLKFIALNVGQMHHLIINRSNLKMRWQSEGTIICGDIYKEKNHFVIQIQSSTMDGMFEDGVDQFVLYERDQAEGKKSRNQKKKEKLEKLRAGLKDPEQRRERHMIRRQQEKKKMMKEIEGMTEEEAREFIKAKREKKKMVKERTIKALESGMPILIDMVYEDKMNEKENKSLATQIELIMKVVKLMENPPGIHLCSVGGEGKKQLQKMKYHYWTLKSNEEDVVEVSKMMNKKPIYLSPDASDTLDSIDPDAAYIIGGLVDRTVMKDASLSRARQLGIPAVCLPIRSFMKSRTCLNLDHVVMMLNKFEQCKDWKKAFDYGAPKRWKRQVGSKQEQQEGQSDECQPSNTNEQSTDLLEAHQSD